MTNNDQQRAHMKGHSALHALMLGTWFIVSPSAQAADTEKFGYVPNPKAHFENALSKEQITRELNLNTQFDGLLAPKPKSLKAGTTSIFGSIRNNFGEDVCALVLANGAFMFSCNPIGSWSLTPPLDSNNQVTLFGFASGHFPFQTLLGSSGGRFDITLNVATVTQPVTLSAVTFNVTDVCHDGYGIDYKFYDETNNLVWPSATTHYFTTFDDTLYSHGLSCRTGANVCYGARNESPFGGYWGVDDDNSKSCADCCIRCQDGGSLSARLSC